MIGVADVAPAVVVTVAVKAVFAEAEAPTEAAAVATTVTPAGATAADVTTPRMDETAEAGNVAVGFAASELRTEDTAAFAVAVGFAARELSAADRAALEATGPDNTEEMLEDKATWADEVAAAS